MRRCINVESNLSKIIVNKLCEINYYLRLKTLIHIYELFNKKKLENYICISSQLT